MFRHANRPKTVPILNMTSYISALLMESLAKVVKRGYIRSTSSRHGEVPHLTSTIYSSL